MSQVTWLCPHCGTELVCQSADVEGNLSCPKCKGVSCPGEYLRAAAMSLAASLAQQEQRQFRQMLREFRTNLRDANNDVLKQLLGGLGDLAMASAGTEAAPYVEVLAGEVEAELDSRVTETGWDEAKRLARRGAKATKAWLSTEDGKAVAGGVAVVAALLGFNYLDD